MEDLNLWGILMSIFVIVGTFGNLIVLIIIVKYKKLRTVQNLFIASLAIGDLLVCGFVMPFGVYELITNQKWYLGGILCRIWTSVDLITMVGTIWSLCVLTVDRLLAVRRPLFYAAKQSSSNACTVIFLIWIFAIALEIPMIVSYEVSDDEMNLCYIVVGKEYRVFAAIFTFYIPFVIIFATNFFILHVARARIRRRNHIGAVTHLSTNSAITPNEPRTAWHSMASDLVIEPGTEPQQESVPASRHHSTHSRAFSTRKENTPLRVFSISENIHRRVTRRLTENTFRRNRKTSFFVAAFCLSFVVCWFPFSTYLVCVALEPSIAHYISPFMPVLLQWFGWMNSFVNCFFYGILKPDLRIHIRKLVMKRLRFMWL